MRNFLKLSLFAAVFLISNSSSQAATVSGTVRLEGQAPEPKTMSAASDPSCKKLHPNGIVLQSVEADGQGNLKNAFLYVDGEGLSSESPKTSVSINQAGCQYEPHVAGVQVGQALELINSDSTLHNVHAVAKTNKEFNLGMPIKDMRIKRKFDKPEIMVRLKCEVHPWMSGYVGVLDHPYFDVSETSGAYAIENLPPGKYTLHVWHESLGAQSRPIEITEAGQVIQADFTLSASSKA